MPFGLRAFADPVPLGLSSLHVPAIEYQYNVSTVL